MMMKTCDSKDDGSCILSAQEVPQSYRITAASPSDCLVSYLVHSLVEIYPFAEMQLVFSAAIQKLSCELKQKKATKDPTIVGP